MPVPSQPKIYHIVHVDRLQSIVGDAHLWSDAVMQRRNQGDGTVIGIDGIKQRRLEELALASHPDLYVGQCVPFYFCPRSVMLYLIYRGNHPNLAYRDGQTPIVHLEADLRRTVAWADAQALRWAFTSSNAGSFHFEDFSDLAQLGALDWDAIKATDWRGRQEGKQAEFLLEHSFPWQLITRIGVRSNEVRDQVLEAIEVAEFRPPVEVRGNWYY